MARLKKTKNDTATGPDRTARRPARGPSEPKKRLSPDTSLSDPLEVPAMAGRPTISQSLYARLTGCSSRTLADWEAGKVPGASALRRVKEIDRFCSRLAEVVAADAIPTWLETPNQALGGLRPVEVVESGEIDRLWDMLYYLESGVPG